jgi:AraC-like DNA-binding protein
MAADRVRRAGIELGPLLSSADLAPGEIDDEKARIEVGKQVTLLNLAAEALADDLLGHHLGQEFELPKLGPLYYVMASAPALGDAFARVERYSTITNEGIVVRCEHRAGFRVRLAYVGVPRHSDRHQMEFTPMALVRVPRQVTATNLRPLKVAFTHPPCAGSDQLATEFGCPVEFGTEQDEIVFATDVRNLPVMSADRHLQDFLVEYCEQALAHRRHLAESLRTRVENAITPLLPHGKARIDEVARALSMSRRTLTRRLAAEGLTFLEILDAMRTDLAVHHLKHTTFSISQIAWLLGFQEVSAFTHAFKRWTGETPSRFLEGR